MSCIKKLAMQEPLIDVVDSKQVMTGPFRFLVMLFFLYNSDLFTYFSLL